uniref:Uncharacterized protein n=1 Tax=viral metagenome TaxID=1070528 RepID=A0A6C0HTJ1_9ZZZZ
MGSNQSTNNAPPETPKCDNNGIPTVSECKADCKNMINGKASGTQNITTTTTNNTGCLFEPTTTTVPCSKECPCIYSNTLIPKDMNYCSRSSGHPTNGGYGYSPGVFLLKNNNDTTRCPQRKTIDGSFNSPEIMGNLACIASNNFVMKNNSYVIYDPSNVVIDTVKKNTDTFKNIEPFDSKPFDNSKLIAIEDDNNKFIEKLNLFNKLYYQYVSKCDGKVGDSYSQFCVIKDDNDNRDFNIERKNPSCIADCPTVKTKLNSWFDGYDRSNIDKHINNLSSTSKYRDDNNKIETKNRENNMLRNDLDKKLRELYNDPGSISLNHLNDYDSTIYSGLLITVIASSLIFYAFTKL